MKTLSITTLTLLCLLDLPGCHKKPPQTTSTPPQINTISFNNLQFQIVQIDLSRLTLNLYYKNLKGIRFANFNALKADLAQPNQQLLFAANAGIFNPDFVPTGLTIIAGQEQTPLNLRDGPGNFYLKPNGIFLIHDGQAAIIDSTQYPTMQGHIQLATQSGPLLLLHNQINPQFNPNSNNRKLRSAIGVRPGNMVLFALSRQPVTFDEFARLFRDQLHCPDALYLDGVISQFYFPTENQPPTPQNFAAILAVTAQN